MKREAEKENRDLIHRKRSPFPGRGEGSCDECRFLQVEPPVNRYDVWRACCCDPKKPVMGARRVVGTAPACSELGPVGIRRPKWCGRKEVKT